MNRPFKNFAAIDIGTNSIKMVIVTVDPLSGNYSIIGKEREMVRLGHGSSDMKHLSKTSIERGIFTLHKFKKIADSMSASIRAVATSAVREAENKEEFIKTVKNQTGINIEVISGAEEGRLIFLGVNKSLKINKKKIFVVTIGGGSTEFIVGKGDKISFDATLKLGSNRLTEKFFPHGEIKKGAIRECRKFIQGMLDPVKRNIHNASFDMAIGTSGTFTAIMDLMENGSHDDFDIKQLSRISRELCDARTSKERAGIKGLDPSRTDIIVAGALILEEVMEEFKLKKMMVTESGLREGLIIDTLQRFVLPKKSDLSKIKRSSIDSLLGRYRVEKKHCEKVAELSVSIFDQTKKLHGLGNDERQLLTSAALLHDIGLFISQDQHHIHSYYVIRNSELLGFTEDEKELMANISRYHRKSHPKIKHSNFVTLPNEDKIKVLWLSSILRVADGLDRGHAGAVKRIHLKKLEKKCILSIYAKKGHIPDLEIWGAGRKKSLFEVMTKKPLSIGKVV